jgi:16S rRNA (guanine(527)-N(7))-methyltransferase RsmG
VSKKHVTAFLRLRTKSLAGGQRMESLQELLFRAGVRSGSKAAQQMSLFLELLERWNARINLTGSIEWKAVRPLVEEAVWAAGRYPEDVETHLDIGSGAGFPALPLRILIPRMHLDMVESRTKRCAFLETVIQELGLEHTHVINERLEALLEVREGTWDCISWKALKLGVRGLSALAAQATERSRFWMFHGKDLAVENVGALEQLLILERREACPARKGWWLSVYRKRSPE